MSEEEYGAIVRKARGICRAHPTLADDVISVIVDAVLRVRMKSERIFNLDAFAEAHATQALHGLTWRRRDWHLSGNEVQWGDAAYEALFEIVEPKGRRGARDPWCAKFGDETTSGIDDRRAVRAHFGGHEQILFRLFYARVARLAGNELEKTLKGDGPGCSPSFVGWPALHRAMLAKHTGASAFVDEYETGQPIRSIRRADFRRVVVETWTIPPAYAWNVLDPTNPHVHRIEVRPNADGSPRLLTPAELTCASLMLGSEPIPLADMRPETTPLDVYRAEHVAIEKAVQRARKRR